MLMYINVMYITIQYSLAGGHIVIHKIKILVAGIVAVVWETDTDAL